MPRTHAYNTIYADKDSKGKDSKMSAESRIHPDAMKQMQERGGNWAAYENKALDSSSCGDLRFLQFGEGRTFAVPPSRYPDTQFGTGWRYCLIGTVDLVTGDIKPIDKPDETPNKA